MKQRRRILILESKRMGVNHDTLACEILIRHTKEAIVYRGSNQNAGHRCKGHATLYSREGLRN
jgi:hypothetical protein